MDKKALAGVAVGASLIIGGGVALEPIYESLTAKTYDGCNTISAPISDIESSLTTYKIRESTWSVREMDSKEKADFKSCEIVKKSSEFSSFYSKDGYAIEIVGEIEKIDGGVQVFARAWKDGVQLGFGSDGSVDIERFRIFNPPVLVEDPKGTITREYPLIVDMNDISQNTILVKTYREDLVASVVDTLFSTIKESGKTSGKIVEGRIGKTTDTFYPNDGKPGSTSTDGNPEYRNGATWATAHDATDATNLDANGTASIYTYGAYCPGYYIARGLYYFDTSSLPDGDIISSATFSLYAFTKTGSNESVSVVGMSGTSADNDYALSDYSKYGTTKFASDIGFSSISTSAYNDFSLNASGIAAITLTGVTKIGTRTEKDVSNTTATLCENVGFSPADAAGTTQDPKLVVVHSAGVVSTENNGCHGQFHGTIYCQK